MGIVYQFKCDGCGAVKEPPGADYTKPPKGWRSFSINANILSACSVKCGVAAVEKKLLLIFQHDASR